MGAEIGIGALLGAAGISALGSVTGAAISSQGASAINHETMDFNREEAAKNRQFQKDMYNQQLSDQESIYNKYQSPEAIARQLASVGVNPSSIFGSGKASGLGNMPSVPSPPSGAQASVSGLLNPAAPFGEAFQHTTQDAVSVLNSLTDKHLKDAQTLKVLADKAGQDYANQILKIEARVSEWKIPQEAKAHINNLISSAALNEAQGRLTDAKTDVEQLMKYLTTNQIMISNEELNRLKIDVAWLDRIRQREYDLLGEKAKTERTQQRSNIASANESNAQANLANENATTVKELRRWQVDFERARSESEGVKSFVDRNSAFEQLGARISELKAMDMLPSQVEQALEHARKENDWYTYNEIVKGIDTSVRAVGTYYGAKTGQGFVNAQNVRNRIESDYKQYQMKQPKKVYNADTGEVYWSRDY